MPAAGQRRLARWGGRRHCHLKLERPIVSFTFDDFPRSALRQAGAILRQHGIAGTYYVSIGLMGRETPTGQMFTRDDLNKLVEQKHELACHTYDHCDAWATSPAAFEASILRNQSALASLLPGVKASSLSYPISYPRPGTKRRVQKHFTAARGGGQTYNRGAVDLNYLRAFFLEQSRDDLDGVKRVIDAACEAHAWLIFATHDVCDSPTRFGCTPEFFERVVEHSGQSGARLLPVGEALELIQ